MLILNLRSGSAAASSRELARAARGAGAEVIEVVRGTDLQLAVRSRLRDGVRQFIVGGGDGTIRNVIQPLVGSEATLGLIPLGTYNRFARDARLPLAWSDALDVALHGRVEPVDVGYVNDSAFLSAATFGVHPALLEERERLRGRCGNGVALAAATAVALRAFPVAQLTLEVDARRQRIVTPVFAVSVNRVAFEGGLPRRHTLTGGVLSAWWLAAPGRAALVAQLGAMLMGRRDAVDVHEVASRQMLICREGTSPAGVDGEVTSVKACLSLRVREQSLLVRMH
ncbi:MAG: diacylglycerol/lipid kinase family protein [Thermoanaerobaculia bacterium]